MSMKTFALAVALLSQAYLASAQTCGSDTGGNTYNVGGGSNPVATIGEVPLLALQPGDWVCIYPGTYNEKFLINVEGTVSQPIVFSGVPDVNGNLPVIDGDGASTPQYLNYWNEVRNVIKVGGGSPSGVTAQYIRIQNLKITGGYVGNSFTDDRGSSQSYVNNAACIQVERGQNIDIVGNEITGCGNGIFSGTATYDLLIEDNYIHGNGVSGRFYEHNTYIESIRVTYRFNRFGPLCSTCLGNNLKDRSAGAVVAYNYIEGGNRQLDLVNSSNLKSLPEYATTYVYGNILVEMDGEGNRQMVHFGGEKTDADARPYLYFYHNTALSKRTDRNTLFVVGKVGSTVEAYNNIIVATDSAAGIELLASGGPGFLNMYNNLISNGYDDCYSCSNPNVVHSGTMNVNDQWPFFSDSNYQNTNDVHLSKSLLLGADLTSVPGLPSITEEYVYHTSSMARSAMDLGAFGFGSSGPASPETTAAPTQAPFAAPTTTPTTTPTTPPDPCASGAYYEKKTATVTYSGALALEEPGCTLAPISSAAELALVAAEAGGNNQCWIGITTATPGNSYGGWMNPDGSSVPADSALWNNGEPNNTPGPQPTATVNRNGGGLLRDVRESDYFSCAIYKCCAAPASTDAPTGAPFAAPTTAPFAAPTTAPFAAPTTAPFAAPTTAPFAAPTTAPFAAPTTAPFAAPTTAPFAAPTTAPFAAPTTAPFAAPTTAPVATPFAAPTTAPFAAPTTAPTTAPVAAPASFVEIFTVSDVSASAWTTVPLPKTYVSPIVMCSPINANPTMPEVLMVETITSNSFDIKLLNVAPNVDAHCLVVEQEAWVLGSETLHVMTFNV